jgi:hypothetical protein
VTVAFELKFDAWPWLLMVPDTVAQAHFPSVTFAAQSSPGTWGRDDTDQDATFSHGERQRPAALRVSGSVAVSQCT